MTAQIFGIDHGNGNIKGTTVNIPFGLVRYATEPGRFMNEDILEYEGSFYTLSEQRLPFKENKTSDEDYFILTLFLMMKEASAKGVSLNGKDVILGVGLPPADFGQQAAKFRKYFLNHSQHGISFRMNGKIISFYIKDVYVSPQNFAAVMCFKASLFKKYRTVNCIDIGDGTVDLLVIRTMIAKYICVVGGQIEWFRVLILYGIPYGLPYMILYVSRWGGISGSLGALAFEVIIAALFGLFIAGVGFAKAMLYLLFTPVAFLITHLRR